MNTKGEGPSIDALLRHLGCGIDIRGFSGTASEKIALVHVARVRGLIAWTRARACYEVTPIGWRRLEPRRRFGVASLVFSTAAGAIVGAAALASTWLPAAAPHHTVRGHPLAPISRLERPSVTQTSRPLEASPRDFAPPPTESASVNSSASPGSIGAVAADPGLDAMSGLEPAKLADQPAAGQPSTEAASTGFKHAAVRKSRHKTVYRRRRGQTGPTWAYAQPWRAQPFRHAGYGGQGAWLGYR
jgi:hypothetical protein